MLSPSSLGHPKLWQLESTDPSRGVWPWFSLPGESRGAEAAISSLLRVSVCVIGSWGDSSHEKHTSGG